MILSDGNLRLNEIIGDAFFFVYRVDGVFGSNEQLIFLSINKGDIVNLLRRLHNDDLKPLLDGLK